MNEVVKFLQENPVQYLATVGRDGKAKCRPFMFCFERTESCGSAQIIRKMFIRIFRITPILKFVFLLRRMRGFA